MPSDLASLTTAFSGLQLVAVVAVFMELRGLKEFNKRVMLENDARDIALAKISARLSHVMGRMHIKEDDDK